MKIYFTIILLSLFLKNFGQNEINYTDSNGYKQGLWEEYFPNGQKKYQTFYINDTIYGKYTSYYENGNIKTFFWSYNGKKDSIFVVFNEFGFKKIEMKYKNGNLIYYKKYNNDGVLHYEEEYDTICNYSTNRIFAPFSNTPSFKIINYKNIANINKVDSNYNRQGLWLVAYPNGKLKYQTYYCNDTIIGSYISFYPNGNIECVFNVSHKKLNGKHLIFSNNGELEEVRIYQNNKLTYSEFK